ncbi:MAG: energy-coupling factor ABC transporter ATP-binding protein [Spirochaetes bacterium]|nr:energy-coupling factor ABC transporter ATP-binding protein [Spirochaetota bacterium]
MNKYGSIIIKDLFYSYPDGTQALQGINLIIHPQESVALIGANGAGKSTLLMNLNGTLLPHSGTVQIDNHVVTKKELTEIRKKVGMVFQNTDDQLFMPSVFDDITFGPLNLGYSPEKTKQIAFDIMTELEILELQKRPPYKLSGGEKRKVAIATILAMSPDILVFDEPTSNLDIKNRRNVINIMQNINQTLLVSSHDLEFLLEVCQRCVIIDQGKVVADGEIRKILGDEELLQAYHQEKPHSLIPHHHD